MSEETTRKPLLSKWDKVWLFVIAFIGLYIILQKFGIHMVERTEKMEVIDRPHTD